MDARAAGKACECDMRGMLSFMILWILSAGPVHGQQIARNIERRKGSRPTPGTIYPALKALKSKGMIKSEKRGKMVVYSITPRGRKALDSACGQVCRMFGDIFRKYGK